MEDEAAGECGMRDERREWQLEEMELQKENRKEKNYEQLQTLGRCYKWTCQVWRMIWKLAIVREAAIL